MNKLERNPIMPKQNLSPVPEETAYAPGEGILRHPIDPQGPSVSLDALRAEFPFLAIMLFPPQIVSALLVNANVAQNIDVPDGAIIGCFRGNADYYVSKRGNALVPSASGSDNGSAFRPEYSWFALAGVRQFSVVAPNANTIVQLHCYVRL